MLVEFSNEKFFQFIKFSKIFENYVNLGRGIRTHVKVIRKPFREYCTDRAEI